MNIKGLAKIVEIESSREINVKLLKNLYSQGNYIENIYISDDYSHYSIIEKGTGKIIEKPIKHNSIEFETGDLRFKLDSRDQIRIFDIPSSCNGIYVLKALFDSSQDNVALLSLSNNSCSKGENYSLNSPK